MVEDVGAAEPEAGDESCGHAGGQEAARPGAEGQAQAQPRVRDGWVVQGAADGQVPVIGHGGQEEALGRAKGEEDKELGEAA